MKIREATEADFAAIWPIFEAIVSAGETYAYSRTTTKDEAMQFNFVASTNEGAVRLWNKLGFETIGLLPKAFLHPTKDYVDALVMYKWLQD